MNLQSAIIAILGGICILLFNLWQGAHDAHTSLQSSVAQAQKQAEADAARQRVEQERILADTARGWSDAVAWHRAHPRVVRVLPGPDCHLPQAGTVPAAPGEPDGAPGEPAEYPAPDATGCVLDAAQVMWLQDWIKKTHEASK